MLRHCTCGHLEGRHYITRMGSGQDCDACQRIGGMCEGFRTPDNLTEPCDACGAEPNEPCRPGCLGAVGEAELREAEANASTDALDHDQL